MTQNPIDAQPIEKWYEAMEYIRNAPRGVHEDQVKSQIIPDVADVYEFLTKGNPDFAEKKFLKRDGLTGDIFTIPSARKELDPLLESKRKTFIYNKWLYANEEGQLSSFPPDYNFTSVSKAIKKCINDGTFTNKNDTLNIRFEKGKRIKSFNLPHILKILCEDKKFSSIKSIGVIDAQGVIFMGETLLANDPQKTLPLIGGLFFDNSVFVDSISIRDLIFCFNRDLSSSRVKKRGVSFRNVRFFNSVSFRNVSFSGETEETEVSFEDSRIEKELSFVNVCFDNTMLNCFQTIMGNYYGQEKSPDTKITLANSSFADKSQIDFTDAETENCKVEVHNLLNMPVTRLCFCPKEDKNGNLQCPKCRLVIENCEITHTLYTGNVDEISLKNSKNFSRIVAAENWGTVNDKPYKKKTKGLCGTTITNKLLLAVYNDTGIDDKKAIFETRCSKANEFVMLKENFASEGSYEDEDLAYILYMEFKPYDNGRKNNKREGQYQYLYRVLYAIGKYGLSPRRVFFTWVITVVFFGALFCGHSYVLPLEPFSIGNALGDNPSMIVSSFLYSIGNAVPFASQFEPLEIVSSVLTIIESAFCTFLVGYFSVAVIRKTLR